MLFTLIDDRAAPPPRPERVQWLREWSYAHRGLHRVGVPENSLAAASGAVAAGLGIECDVQKSRDGEAMVFHDWELDRLTSARGAVGARTASELAAIALSGSDDERIPALRALLALVGGQVPLLIEVKSRRERRPAPLCLAVRRALEGYAGRVAVMSFDPRVSRWFAVHAPQVVRGLVVTEENERTFAGYMRRHAWLWHARPDFIAYDVRDLPSRFADAQRKRGLPLLTWTVRSAELRERAEKYADAPIAEGAGVAQGRSVA
ncbi:MAG TPA: glycerophosphodiester phosphodiesterase family protein [Croceibacterium sp.]|nr:glycerophosphodiester phosphodiesterase family protein [Croceibacterium sp.]